MTAVTSRPLIGITGSGISELPVKTKLHDAFYSSPAPYVDSVARAGGIPIVIPSVDTDFETLLNRLDGIVFSGGSDIHPDRYDGDPDHPNLLPHDAARDHAEIALMSAALNCADLPILAVCRGLQVLNVVLGGSLLEHLPDHIDDDFHRDELGLWTTHDVSVDPDSKLAAIMQETTVHTMSGHHQALGDVASGLKVVATSKDSVVEAVENCTHPWCIGVQWHPEKTADRDLTQQRIFDALVANAARARAAN